MAVEEVMADGGGVLSDSGPDASGLDMTGDASPRAVGHNIYILAHQLAKHNNSLAQALRPDNSLSGTEALQYYKKHTAQIEVRTCGLFVKSVRPFKYCLHGRFCQMLLVSMAHLCCYTCRSLSCRFKPLRKKQVKKFYWLQQILLLQDRMKVNSVASTSSLRSF